MFNVNNSKRERPGAVRTSCMPENSTSFLRSPWIIFFVRRVRVAVKLQRPARENLVVLLKAYARAFVLYAEKQTRPLPRRSSALCKRKKNLSRDLGQLIG